MNDGTKDQLHRRERRQGLPDSAAHPKLTNSSAWRSRRIAVAICWHPRNEPHAVRETQRCCRLLARFFFFFLIWSAKLGGAALNTSTTLSQVYTVHLSSFWKEEGAVLEAAMQQCMYVCEVSLISNLFNSSSGWKTVYNCAWKEQA